MTCESPTVRSGIIFVSFLIMTLFATQTMCEPHAKSSEKTLPTSKVIRAIIGEASGEGYRGMLAVAEGIRNRGHLRGVYGLKAPHVDREPTRIWRQARRAWRESQYTNLVLGADHWHNVGREGHTYWTRKLTKTTKIGRHTFYK